MNTIRIPIFLFPWEIDKFQSTADRLKLCANFLININDWDIIIDVTLNVSNKAIDWDKSNLKKDFFINSFNNICEKLNFVLNVESNIETTDKIFGCVDKRRESISKESDYVMWLDTDVFFPSHLLYILIQSINSIKNEYFIICPQLLKLWDTSWDNLTNHRYKNEDRNTKPWKMDKREIFHCDLNNQLDFAHQKVGLYSINNFKFAGGWCVLFSKNLLKKIGIPSSFGSYGLEDTFILEGCNKLKEKNYDVCQYIIENLVIGEHQFSKFNENYNFQDQLNIILPPKEEQLKRAQNNFVPELDKLNKKI